MFEKANKTRFLLICEWHWHSSHSLLVANGWGPSHCTCDAHNIVSFTPFPAFLLSVLTRTVCVSRFVCSLSVNLISFNALGLCAQLAAALAAYEYRGRRDTVAKGGGAAASAATEATLFVIKCEKYENSETKHAALHWLPQARHARTPPTPSSPHWPFCTASLPSHAPLSCDTQFATAWTWPNFSFSLIAAPTRFAYNGLPLTAWQRLFIPCNIKGCSGKLVC